jgi:DNA polymerase
MSVNKNNALEEIAREIKFCKICKEGKTGEPVPGEGNPDAAVVFIGEAPGKTEAKTGRPFVGRSGQLLRSTIRSIDLQEKDVYITSPVKYLPLRGTPSTSDIAHGRTHLKKQLGVIDPKIIVLLGSVAAQGVLEEKIPIAKEHGKTRRKDGKLYFLTYHPAAGLRFPKFKITFIQDFKKLQLLIKAEK